MDSKKPLPKQKIPRSQKTDKWAESVVEALEGFLTNTDNNGRSSKYRKKRNYDLFNGILDKEDFEYVLNPYGYKADQFPADLQHYDIISPKLLVLIGEEINRPFNFRVVTTNAEAISSLEKMQHAKIAETLRSYILDETDESALKELDGYLKYNFSDMRERTAQHLLTYLYKAERLDDKFSEGYKHALIAGEEIYWVGVVENKPTVRLVNPLDISIVMDADSDNIDDAPIIIEERYLTLSTVLDEFHSELTNAEIKALEDKYYPNGRPGEQGPLIYDATQMFVKSGESYLKDKGRSRNSNNLIRVVHFEWKSMRRLLFATTVDHEGRKTTELLDENFEIPDYAMKVKGVWFFDNLEVEEHWVSEYWTATKIDEKIFKRIQPLENQRRSLDNPSLCKSSYTGKIYNAMNSESTSLVDRMATYQYLYNIIYYRLEILLAKDKGKAMVMDIAQIPASEGWDVDKWMYYLDAMGIAFVNSFEKGPQGQTPTFNQFSQIDLSTGNQIQYYINILGSISMAVGQLVGVSPQREGQVQASELVGNVERSVQQSAHITEYWFHKHNECKQLVLEALIDAARIAYKQGKKINYVSDDGGRIFLNLDESEFSSAEYGLFVSNSSKDTRALESLRALAQAALQNDKISARELATIITSDDMATIKRTLEDAEDRRQANEQALIEKQNEGNMQVQQATQEWEMMKMENDNQQNELDRQNKIELELIKQAASGNIVPEDDNGPTSIDYEKLRLEKEKANNDDSYKKADLMLKARKLEDDKEKTTADLKLKQRKLELDAQKLKEEKAQKEKDRQQDAKFTAQKLVIDRQKAKRPTPKK